MAENKTQPTKLSVTAFINRFDDKQKRADVKKVAALMRKATGARAKMWGANIVGFGQYHYDEAVPDRLIQDSVKYIRKHYETK
jgi:hypothetical protein